MFPFLVFVNNIQKIKINVYCNINTNTNYVLENSVNVRYITCDELLFNCFILNSLAKFDKCRINLWEEYGFTQNKVFHVLFVHKLILS